MDEDNKNYCLNNTHHIMSNKTKDSKNICLHIDLSSTENDELMQESLFKILILRYMNSSHKLYYLGYDINIIVEIPIGFIDFMKKFRILQLFKNIHIDKLIPLILEKNIKIISNSPISIVVEILTYYKDDTICITNINLDSSIIKSE